ncbi:MAG: hypothetical protein FJ290_03580 [Planctomycetes bacterium]|nr:hypothetical protein [Planctomycetota bacterium]
MACALQHGSWLPVVLLAAHSSSLCWGLDAATREQLRSDDERTLEKATSKALLERKELVTELCGILANKRMQAERVPAVVNAIRLLGDLRAREAAPGLLALIRFDSQWGMPDPSRPVTRIPAPATVDPGVMSKTCPCVAALIAIRVPASEVIEEMLKHWFQEYYLAVLLGTEGKLVTAALLNAELERAASKLTGAEQQMEKDYRADKPVGVMPPNLQRKLALEAAAKLVEDYREPERSTTYRR